LCALLSWLPKALAALPSKMRLLLTGTPVQNSLAELWALLHYLLPDLFASASDFHAWFVKPFADVPGLNEYEMSPGPEEEGPVIAQLQALLSPFLLQRSKADVLGDSLPPKVEAVVRVPLSSWQAMAYDDLKRRMIRLMQQDGDAVSSEKVNNALMHLRKIVLHPYLFEESGWRINEDLYRTSGKMECLDRMLAKLLPFGHKILIFSQFTTMLDILEDFLHWRGVPAVRLDGQTPHSERQERMRRFTEQPEISVFLLSSRAGGLGLNLQAADTVILFDLDWNPQNDKQAVARAHRVGQEREVRAKRREQILSARRVGRACQPLTR